MNQNTQHSVVINVKDLLLVILRKAWLILLVGLLLAGALFTRKILAGVKDENVLDTSVRLEGESDLSYSTRVLNVERASDLINSIQTLNGQIDNQREYMTDSILMQINAENETVTTAQLIVSVDSAMTSGMDNALVSSYSQDLLSGWYLSGLADELGTKQEYLAELISVDYEPVSSYIVSAADSTGSAGTFTIKVVGPSTDITEQVMDCILAEIDSKCDELNESLLLHEITIAGRQSSFVVDSTVRDCQIIAATRFESLQKQITTYDDALKELATRIGVSNKSSLYNYFLFDQTARTNKSKTAALKSAVIGFIAGAFVVVLWIAALYIFSNKFSSQAKFFAKFPGVKRVGVAKPFGKRSAYVRFIDRTSDDDSKLSDEDNNRLIAANIKNIASEMDKVLFTGTAETAKIEELVKRLNIKADVKGNIFANPENLEQMSGYDGILIVEQRNCSDLRIVSKELDYIANTKARLIGAIVI